MKFNLKRSEDAEPFMVMEAETRHSTPTKIEKGTDNTSMSPVGYAEKLAKGKFKASVEAIASRMGRNVIIEAEGDEPDLEDVIKNARLEDPVEGQEVTLHADGDIVKTDPAKQIVFGWAYVMKHADGSQVIDKSGDFVDEVEELENTAYQYVLKSRASDADHTNVKGGSMVESIVFTPEKIEKMGIPEGVVPLGWWVGYKIEDKSTWDRVEKGELVAFSIHGSGTRTKVAPA